MSIGLTQDKTNVETTANMKLFTNILLSLGIFFFVLFFVYWSAGNASNDLGSNEADDFIYQLFIILTTLTVTLLVMQFYYNSSRILKTLKYMVIIGNAVIVALTIHQLMRGYDDLFGASDSGSLEYTYGGLGLGFVGAGTLLCLIHNLYGISETL